MGAIFVRSAFVEPVGESGDIINFDKCTLLVVPIWSCSEPIGTSVGYMELGVSPSPVHTVSNRVPREYVPVVVVAPSLDG
jgi:hypothetical protein